MDNFTDYIPTVNTGTVYSSSIRNYHKIMSP